MRFRASPPAFGISVIAAITIAPAAPPVTASATGPVTPSTAVVDDRASPEELPVRKPKPAAQRDGVGNPLRTSDAGPPESSAKRTSSTGGGKATTTAAKDSGAGAAATSSICGRDNCASCTRKVPVCKPKWEDKKTKRPVLAIECAWECVRPWEPHCEGACCEEKTTPCGEVRVKKKLYKTEEERCERVLKYEVEMRPAAPCCDPPPTCDCLGCRCLGKRFHGLFGWCR